MASGVGSKKYKVGVIGHTGRGNYGHGLDTVWQRIPRTEIAAVADADAKGLAGAQARLPGARPFADYREMLETVRPEIVAVAPRHADQHHAMMTAAIQSGARAIYVEKPFVRTPAEADDIVRQCANRGVKVAIAHRNRYHPALPVLGELLASGTFGVPLEIRGRGKEDQRGGGLDLWVLGSHVLNLGVYLAGAPIACSATAFQNGVPATDRDIREGDEGLGLLVGDEIHARFEMERSIPLFFDSRKDRGDKAVNFGLQLICSKAVVDLRVDTEPLIHVRRGNPFNPATESTPWIPITSAGIGKAEPITQIRPLIAGHQQAVLDLIDAMETGREPLCGPADGRTVVEMIQGVFASHMREGARVPLPLKNRGNALQR